MHVGVRKCVWRILVLGRCVSCSLTSLAVGQSVLQVEGVVANGLLAGGAQKAVHMPSLLQGIDDFLLRGGKKALL